VIGAIENLPAALIAAPVADENAALSVKTVIFPGFVALPITALLDVTMPRLELPFPSVAFRVIGPPFVVIVTLLSVEQPKICMP
jgi:hypothetical protein